MKHLFTIILLAATATTAMADISMGESRRRPAPKAPQASTPEQQSITPESINAQKTQLLELLRGVTNSQNAAQLQAQIQQLSTAIAKQPQPVNTTPEQAAAASQLDAQLQQEIARVSGITGAAFTQQSGLHQVIFRYLPEEGYDTSGVHDVGNNTREPERPQRTAPPLRPMPKI